MKEPNTFGVAGPNIVHVPPLDARECARWWVSGLRALFGKRSLESIEERAKTSRYWRRRLARIRRRWHMDA